MSNNKSDTAQDIDSKPSDESKKRKFQLGCWTKTFLFVLVAIVIGEAGLRVLADSNSKYNIFIGAQKQFHPVRRFSLKPNYEAAKWSINSRGFLGEEFDTTSNDGHSRVVVLGDSCTFLPPAHNYPSVLEEKLKQNQPDKNYSVINASCSGYDSEQARHWYTDEITNYDHDVLIIYLGWNDMGQFGPEGLAFKRADKGYLKEPNALQKAIISSYILRSFFVVSGYFERKKDVVLENLSAEDQALYDDYYPQHYEDNLREIISTAAANDRRVYLLNFASLITPDATEDEMKRMHFPRGMGKSLPKYLLLKAKYDEAVNKVARETETPIIDIASLFQDEESRKAFSDSVHFNHSGSDKIGTFLEQELRSSTDNPIEPLPTAELPEKEFKDTSNKP